MRIRVEHRDEDVPWDTPYRFNDYWHSLQLPTNIDQCAQSSMTITYLVSQADAEGVIKVAEIIAAGAPGLLDRLFEGFGDGEVRHKVRDILGS
jgi:hypothetical protein